MTTYDSTHSGSNSELIPIRLQCLFWTGPIIAMDVSGKVPSKAKKSRAALTTLALLSTATTWDVTRCPKNRDTRVLDYTRHIHPYPSVGRSVYKPMLMNPGGAKWHGFQGTLSARSLGLFPLVRDGWTSPAWICIGICPHLWLPAESSLNMHVELLLTPSYDGKCLRVAYPVVLLYWCYMVSTC